MMKFLLDPDPEGTAGGSTGDGATETVTIDGETKEVSVKDLKDAYQKNQSADARFREASDLKKEAEGALALKAAMTTLKEQPGNPDAFRVVATAQGWDGEQINSALKEYEQAKFREGVQGVMNEGKTTPNAPNAEGEGEPDSQSDGIPSGISLDQIALKVAEMLGPTLQKNFTVGADNLEPKLKKALMSLIGKNLTGSLQLGVDSDEYLGSIAREGSAEQLQGMRSLINTEAKRRAASGDDLNSPTVQKAIIQEVSGQLKGLGVKPVNARVPPPGLGASGSGSAALHQGEPTKRPTTGMRDAHFDENLLDRIMEAAAQDRVAGHTAGV